VARVGVGFGQFHRRLRHHRRDRSGSGVVNRPGVDAPDHQGNLSADSALDFDVGFKVYGCLMKISELADQAGVTTSAIRYYERIGLLPTPIRTDSGYRSYDDGAAARLVFVTQAKRLGLTLEQISDLLPIWDGINCPATHDQISMLVAAKLDEVHERIRELQAFADQLTQVSDSLRVSPPPAAGRPDISCWVPVLDHASPPTPVAYLSSIRGGDTTRHHS
jgi:DNA-binding transcriptional MerR regulator